MTRHRMSSSPEVDAAAPVQNTETSSLLSNDRESVGYGSDDSVEGDSTCRLKPKFRREGTEAEEEVNLLPRSVEDVPSKSMSVVDTFLVFPLSHTSRWLNRGWSEEVSMRLQNTGSVARDHLALERTFLAYMRTSLAVASAGVALVQLFNTSDVASTERIEKYARPLGASVIAMGLIILGIGLIRYFVVQSALVRGYFPVARSTPVFIGFSLTALVTVVFSLLVTGHFEF